MTSFFKKPDKQRTPEPVVRADPLPQKTEVKKKIKKGGSDSDIFTSPLGVVDASQTTKRTLG